MENILKTLFCLPKSTLILNANILKDYLLSLKNIISNCATMHFVK
jgi:hypothetical protein